jgi:hypothetical protein
MPPTSATRDESKPLAERIIPMKNAFLDTHPVFVTKLPPSKR